MVTGGYNKSGNIMDINGTFNQTLPANFDMKRGKNVASPKKYINKRLPQSSEG